MDSSQLMIQVLGKLPLCKGFSPFQLHRMLELCEYRTLKPGVVLCNQGEQVEAFYVLVAGEIIRLGEWGAEVERLVPVEMVGFVEAMTARSYAATWQAEKSGQVFVISRTKFEQMLRVDGEVQDKVRRYLQHIQAKEVSEQSDNQLGDERARYETRIAVLERQLQQQQQKLDVAIDLLVVRGNLTLSEAESIIANQLRDRVPQVLIVDDEPDFRHFVKEALSSLRVIEAQSGIEALEIAKRERLDLVISDIRMPEMDGCTLMSNLRNQFPGLPVLAVSDYLAAEDLKGYGFDGFVEKPVGLDQLQNMVEMTLQK